MRDCNEHCEDCRELDYSDHQVCEDMNELNEDYIGTFVRDVVKFQVCSWKDILIILRNFAHLIFCMFKNLIEWVCILKDRIRDLEGGGINGNWKLWVEADPEMTGVSQTFDRDILAGDHIAFHAYTTVNMSVNNPKGSYSGAGYFSSVPVDLLTGPDGTRNGAHETLTAMPSNVTHQISIYYWAHGNTVTVIEVALVIRLWDGRELREACAFREVQGTIQYSIPATTFVWNDNPSTTATISAHGEVRRIGLIQVNRV